MHELAILAVAATLNLSSLASTLAGSRPPCAVAGTTQAANPPAPAASRPTVCVVDPDMISRE